MSPDPIEINIARLVRESALPLDDARRKRAREAFLRGADGKPAEATGRRLAVAAAALLVCGLVFWAAKAEREAGVHPEIAKERPAAPAPDELWGSGGDGLVQGTLKSVTSREATQYSFGGTSTLPEGLYFRVRIDALEERWAAGRIAPVSRESRPDTAQLKEGRFGFSWSSAAPGMVRLGITAPDSAQDIEIANSLKVKEADRAWTFEFHCWRHTLLGSLGPQLVEVGDLARDVRELVTRTEAACASEEQLLAQKASLIRESERLQSRAENFATRGVYPAALCQISYTARDLATSIPDFKWLEGKFQGPVSYYTDNKRKRTYRQDPFEFAALRRYLDEAEVIAGREFGLWIVKDRRPRGLLDVHRDLVKELSKRPGVSEFSERLVAAGLDPRLEEDLRTVGK